MGFLAGATENAGFSPRVPRNPRQKVFDCVRADLTAGPTEDVIETMSGPWEFYIQVGNARFRETLGKASALVGRNQFIAAAMQKERRRCSRGDKLNRLRRIVIG